MWLKTKRHTFPLVSTVRFSPASSSSHGDGSGRPQCSMETNAFIELEVQLKQCAATTVDIVLLILSHATETRRSKSQSTDREILSTQCKQINAGLNNQTKIIWQNIQPRMQECK
ncbi:hypothetical protein AMECASPLE_029956 [Ameca splendens]|uniref:Uncharacterized protein n=1 Tax=Ameca splendens TaxID=208324 RepID=A0ABV0XJ28_9TELE